MCWWTVYICDLKKIWSLLKVNEHSRSNGHLPFFYHLHRMLNSRLSIYPQCTLTIFAPLAKWLTVAINLLEVWLLSLPTLPATLTTDD